ncbi:thiol-activated cytolysin family protein [Luteibacter aegosomaticola]|uniref:thiol-activated cytolysin family protein n=1 Tax=Luteibacter aegosomaticola TaxID=2911538 RepID=UPI001FF872A0|nr:thiol-activated cytolysin family protein [Luteibacter aegosomaticola]UPG88067.1 thiol-activated cytolysin family protein [Luteibacter aegosomaticola]
MSIGDYIAGLSYDPRVLLSVVADGATQAVPLKERTTQSNAVVICTKTKTSLKKNLSEVAILSPSAGVIFPGALVLADEDLMEGHPTPLALARNSCVLSIDLPGLPNAHKTVVPTGSAVQDYVNAALEEWNQGASREGYVNAARSFMQITQSFSSQQTALDLGFSAKWAGGNVSSQLNTTSNIERSVVVAYFKQVFYTVTMDVPASAAGVFAEAVSENEARQAFDGAHPPAYVRSVDYGRLLMIKMETSSVDTSSNLKGAFEQATSSGVTAGGSLSGKYAEIIKNSTFSVVAIGGGAETAIEVFKGGAEDAINGLRAYIQKGATYRRDNPGLPVAYQVAFLKDNRFATMGFPTDYTETQCVRYPNGFVRFEHSGGYVAKAEVTWKEGDANGNLVDRKWESGQKTAGWSYTLDVPGDAQNLRLKAWAKTGLVWDPWGEILNVALEGPNNKTYVFRGTTLNRKFDVK